MLCACYFGSVLSHQETLVLARHSQQQPCLQVQAACYKPYREQTCLHGTMQTVYTCILASRHRCTTYLSATLCLHTCDQLNKDAAYAPDVSLKAPPQPQDDLRRSVVASGHHSAVVLI